jgi:LysR family transcriptional regulator, benzoate and cis,cis-muconate-responsive activator of ben and cat genes
MIDLEDVRVFVQAAERGNFTAAAADLYTTQPSLSRRIAHFEKTVGGVLFDRSNRRSPKLSALGEMLLPYARQFLADHTRFVDTIELHGQGRAGRIVVTLSEPTAAALPNLCQHIRRLLPDIRICVRECAPGRGVRETLLQREAEVGIVSTEFATDDLDGVTLGVIQHYAVGLGDLLGPGDTGIEWNDLAKMPLLLPLAHDQVRYPAPHGLLDIVHENGSPPILLAMARAGIGVAILAGLRTPPDLVRRPVHIEGVPQRTRLQLAWPRGAPLSVPATQLTDDLRNRAANLGTLILEEGQASMASFAPAAMHISQWTARENGDRTAGVDDPADSSAR